MTQPKQRSHLMILLALAAPAIAEQVLLTIVNYVDAAMVGVLGAQATAAVAINMSPTWFINSVFFGLAVGYSVQAAHGIGAGDSSAVRNILRQAVLATVACGVGLMLLCLPFVRQVPVWMGAEPEILADARGYLLTIAFALPFNAAQLIFSAILRCMGDTRTPLFCGLLSNLLNVVLNTLFIFPSGTVGPLPGLGLGVTGAALATAISIAVGGLFLAYALYHRPEPYRISLRDSYRPDPAVIRRAVRLGIPTAFDRMILSSGQLVMTRVAASFGTVSLAAHHVAITAESICFLPASGVSYAATALVGQSFGAADSSLAKRYGTLSSLSGFFLGLFTGIFLFVLAGPLAGLFSSDAAVVLLAAALLRIVAFSEPLGGLTNVLSGVLRGSGDGLSPLVASVVGMWGIRMLCLWIFAYLLGYGLVGVWLAMNFDFAFRAVALWIRFKQGRWLTQKPDGA